MAALQAKDRGNKAFQSKNYAQAIADFTEAIALDPKNESGSLHVFYSNRAAARLHVDHANQALEDAKMVIELKSDWPKGYSRLGAAYVALGKFPEAVAAYDKGLGIDSSNAALQIGKKEAEQALQYAHKAQGSKAGQTSAPTAGTSLKAFLIGDKNAIFKTVQFALRTIIFLCSLGYLVSFSPFMYATVFKAAIANYILYIAFTHGRPRMEQGYAIALAQDPTCQQLFYSVLMWTNRPYAIALLPLLIIEAPHFVWYIIALSNITGKQQLVAAATPAVNTVMTKFTGNAEWASLPSASKWQTANARIPEVTSLIYVCIGVSLIVELVTPGRNFMFTLIYWQFLRMGYMLSPQLQQSFRMIDAYLLQLTSSPKCPGIVRTGYGKVREFGAKMTAMPQPGEQPQTPKCTVM